MGQTLMDDATLVSRAVGGDRDAFAAVYDRYSGAVYDLCTAILRNPEEAADATLDSFLRAARELVNLRDRSRLRLWLLAVGRHEATARADRRRNAGWPGPGGPGDAQDWDPVESLSEDDRAVLDLHLRHQLEGEELGAVIGLRPAAADARAAKLRAMAETSVGALLLSRADGVGGDGAPCAGLAQVLEGWDGRFTPAMGVRINRHAKRCDACQARRMMLLERLQAMATLPFADAPAWLRPELMLRMELAVSSRTLPGWGEDGFPPGIGAGTGAGARAGARGGRGGRGGGRSRKSVAVGVAVVVLAASGVFLVTHDWGGDSTVSASGRSTSTRPTATTAVPPPTTAGPPTTAPVAVVPTTSPLPSTSLPPTTTGPPATSPQPAPPPPPGPDRDPPGISFGADAASAYVYGCPYSRTGVSADVSDRSQVVWVALFVRRPDGVEESVNMDPDGGRWRATMGDFDTPGTAYFWVEAIDAEGNRAVANYQELPVYACPP
jgi:DNA-directed RNA polymerase specialized sigma24 family protein